MILRMRFRPEFEVFLTRGSGVGASTSPAASGRSANCAGPTAENPFIVFFCEVWLSKMIATPIKSASHIYQKCDVVLLGAARSVTAGPKQKGSGPAMELSVAAAE